MISLEGQFKKIESKEDLFNFLDRYVNTKAGESDYEYLLSILTGKIIQETLNWSILDWKKFRTKEYMETLGNYYLIENRPIEEQIEFKKYKLDLILNFNNNGGICNR